MKWKFWKSQKCMARSCILGKLIDKFCIFADNLYVGPLFRIAGVEISFEINTNEINKTKERSPPPWASQDLTCISRNSLWYMCHWETKQTFKFCPSRQKKITKKLFILNSRSSTSDKVFRPLWRYIRHKCYFMKSY